MTTGAGWSHRHCFKQLAPLQPTPLPTLSCHQTGYMIIVIIIMINITITSYHNGPYGNLGLGNNGAQLSVDCGRECRQHHKEQILRGPPSRRASGGVEEDLHRYIWRLSFDLAS